MRAKEIWDDADELCCPKLRTIFGGAFWVAVSQDPCPTKSCGEAQCHNYGKEFDDPRRLVIVEPNLPVTTKVKFWLEKLIK